MTPNVDYQDQLWQFDSGERFVHVWRSRDSQAVSPLPGDSLPANRLPGDSLSTTGPIALGIIHGLGDHGRSFDGLARWLVSRGIDVYAFDQVGHGQTPGPRMSVPSYDFMLRDIDAFLLRIRNSHPGARVGLLGQSMGGNLVLNHQLRAYSKADFVVAGAPMLRAVNEPGPIQLALFRMLAKIAPQHCVSMPADPTALTRDVEAQRVFQEDPLIQKRISLRLGGALIDSGRWALRNADQLTTPTLIVHGDADRVTSHYASIEFSELADKCVELKIWPDGPHDLHHDIVRDDFMKYVHEWIENQRVSNPTHRDEEGPSAEEGSSA